MTDSTTSTPKRKRAELFTGDGPGIDTASFSFDLHAPTKDGSASPRSKVAHRFRGLAIGSGGGVGGGRTSRSPEPKSIAEEPGDEEDGARKRVKLPDVEMSDGDNPKEPTPQPVVSFAAASGSAQTDKQRSDKGNEEADAAPGRGDQQTVSVSSTSLRFAVEPTQADSTEVAGNSDNSITQNLPPSADTSSDKSRSRKRAGTPPLMLKTNPSAAEPDSEEPLITDPVRASLTWHEDEITVYDPDDSDDDGTGINGIGFRPTPAIAYARTVKRRQQLAEYRKREDREARARRSQRRRGSPASGLVELKEKVEQRRVRFMESTAEVVGTV